MFAPTCLANLMSDCSSCTADLTCHQKLLEHWFTAHNANRCYPVLIADINMNIYSSSMNSELKMTFVGLKLFSLDAQPVSFQRLNNLVWRHCWLFTCLSGDICWLQLVWYNLMPSTQHLLKIQSKTNVHYQCEDLKIAHRAEPVIFVYPSKQTCSHLCFESPLLYIIFHSSTETCWFLRYSGKTKWTVSNELCNDALMDFYVYNNFDSYWTANKRHEWNRPSFCLT